MPVIQNPDGSFVRQKSGRDVTNRGRKRELGAQFALGHDPRASGQVRDATDQGKHAFSLYGGRGNDPGFYGKNFAGAREGWNYNWETGQKMQRMAPDNPNFGQWVPIEDWEQKRHGNMQNYLANNPGSNAGNYIKQRFKKKGGYNQRDEATGNLVNAAGEMRDPRTGDYIQDAMGVYPGQGQQQQTGVPQGQAQFTDADFSNLFDRIFGNGQYRDPNVASNQYGGWRPSWMPQDASMFF